MGAYGGYIAAQIRAAFEADNRYLIDWAWRTGALHSIDDLANLFVGGGSYIELEVWLV